MAAVRPQWTAVKSARDALGLEGQVLLHAGPPLADPMRPPIPMLNAAVLLILHEGWAPPPDAAERLLSPGAAPLDPPYTKSAPTPPAAMFPPKPPAAEIADEVGGSRYYAYLGTG